MTTWPASECGANVELIVVCTGRGSHSNEPQRLAHLLYRPTLPDGTRLWGFMQAPTQQHHAESTRPLPAVDEHDVFTARCSTCGVEVRRRGPAIERLLQRLADDTTTSGRVVTISPDLLLA